MRFVLPPRRIGRALPVGLTIGLFGAFLMGWVAGVTTGL